MHRRDVFRLLKKQQLRGNCHRLSAVSALQIFAVIPFNSPPGFPQFNGVMERSQRKIKRYLHAILKDKEEFNSFAVAVHLSVERANRHRRAVLAGKCAWERREEEFTLFSRRERESIYLEIKRLAKLRKGANAHAWRIAIPRYLSSGFSVTAGNYINRRLIPAFTPSYGYFRHFRIAFP